MKNKIIIGYIPTRRDVFSKEDAKKHKAEILKKLKEFDCTVVDIEDVNSEGLLFNEKDIDTIVLKMQAAKVDGLFFPHCNFGTEDLVAKVASRLNKPVLLWGPRDDAPLADGLRTRDTQCGLFATGKVLRRFNVPFTYIENCHLNTDIFDNGFNEFLSVCSVVTTFKNTRVLQIGPRPAGFWTVICNEGELLEKFGVQIFPVSLGDIFKGVKEILAEKGKDFIGVLNDIKDKMDCSKVPAEDVEKLAALKMLIKDLCIKNGCNCAAIQCWTALQDGLAVMPCAVNGLLSEEGIPTVCETDIHGAVTSVMAQAAVRCSTPVFFADLTVRHPENDNAELLWHCGNFPPSLAKNPKDRELGRHFIFDHHCPGTGEWELKGGDITICRFDGDHGSYSLLISEGKGCKGPKTKGTYVWFEVKDWPALERKIVEGPYIHHCAGVHAKVADILKESCKYINLTPDLV